MKHISPVTGVLIALLITVILLPVSSVAQSISGVVGTLSDGSSVVINGSSFGTKDRGEPLRWWDFDDGGLGSDIDEDGSGIVFDSDTWCSPHYSNENMRDNTPNAMLCGERTADGYDMQYIKTGNLGLSGRKLYFSGYLWFDHGNVPGDDVQIKTLRVGAGNWEAAPRLNQENTDWNCRWTNRSNNCPSEPDGKTLYHSGWDEHNWNYFQLVLDMGDHNTFNGEGYFYQNGNLNADNWQNYQFLCGNDGIMDNVMLGCYMGNAAWGQGYEVQVHYDDIYVDDTWSRVELGNAASYDACSHREAQIPSTWTPSSITVAMNVGTFRSGSQAYLFVIDANNNASAGFPVTIDEGLSDPGPPGPPSTPEVIQ